MQSDTSFPIDVTIVCMDEDKNKQDELMGIVSFELSENGKGEKELVRSLHFAVCRSRSVRCYVSTPNVLVAMP